MADPCRATSLHSTFGQRNAVVLECFRPGFAAHLYRKYCKQGDTVLDTSTGYGGRLVGYLGSGIGGKYIGIDPNTLTHAGNTRLASDLGFADAVELHNLPAEDVPHDVVAGRCDFAFTSPPYFSKEIYSAEPTQSLAYTGTRRAKRGAMASWSRCSACSSPRSSTGPAPPSLISLTSSSRASRNIPARTVDARVRRASRVQYIPEPMSSMHRRVGKGFQSDEIATEPVIVLERP